MKLLTLVSTLALCTVLPSRAPAQTTLAKLPDSPEKAVFVRVCSACHPAEFVAGRQDTRKNWTRTVNRMVVRGAKATDEEIRQVTDYLATNLAYVPGQVKLPDGPGKEAFVKVCSGCHAPDNVVGRDGHEGKLASWISTVDRMIYRGAHGTDTEYDQIAEYLATNFGYIPVTSQLPPGPGKETVEKICAQCHGVTLFIGRAEPRGSWDRMIANMIGRGARGTAEEFEQVAQYLTKTFGPDNAKVYVNRLTADELETELGVSAAEARAIVSYRESNGNIKDWQDLTGVPGFDAAKISVKNKDRLMF